jgi:hypothetical protein
MFATRLATAIVVLSATVAAAQQGTTVTAYASQPTVDYSVPVSVTGVVNGGTSPTGSMRFYDSYSGSDVTVPLSNRTASWTATNLSSGYHPFTVTYLGDSSNLQSSASISVSVRPPRATITSVSPSHLPAGSLDTLIRIEGTSFQGAQLSINGVPVYFPAIDSDTVMRAFLTPAMLANPGTLTLSVTNDSTSTSTPPPAPFVFTIDPPGPPPLSIAIAGAAATASHVTPGGNTAWLVNATMTDLYTTYFSIWTRIVTDTDGDGVVSMDSRQQQPPLAALPPGTVAAVVDVTTGAIRIDVPPGTERVERFFPADGVRGVRNGEVTRLYLPNIYSSLVVVRPGVGAWFANYSLDIAPSTFVPLQGSPAVPATFLPDDVLVAVGRTAVTRARLGDYMPHADPSTPSLIVEDADAVEGNSGFSQLDFPVRLTSPATSVVTVAYETVSWFARDDSDFSSTSGSLTFQPGETLKTVSVPVWGDPFYESNEKMWLWIQQPASAPIIHERATGTIINDDAIPTVSVGDAAPVTEGTLLSTPHVMIFPLTLSEASGDSVSLNFEVLIGAAGNGDLTFGSNQATIPAGATTGSWAVPIRSDSDDEDDELLNVKVAAVFGAALGRGQASGVILDDDAPPVLTPQSATVREGTGTDTTIDIPILVSGTSGRPVSVDYQLVANGSALPADFVAATGTLNVIATTFAINVIPVTIKADALPEQTETFSIVLSHPANATIGQAAATITIADDDGPNGAYATAVLHDQPYLYYRLNEAVGTVAHDSSPNANDGTISSAVIHNVLGALGSADPAVQLAKTAFPESRVGLPGTLGGAGWSEVTLEEWVQVPATAPGSPSQVTLYGQGEFIYLSTSAVAVHTNGASPSLFLPPLNAGWHHVVVVAKSGASAAYVDGVPVTTSDAIFTFVTAATDVAVRGTNGVVDELALYRRALTAADVARHYALRTDLRMTADFDGNGSNDLVLRNAATGANALWLLQGTSYSSTSNLPYLPSDFRIEGSADFDRDGQNDLLLRNYANGNNALWLMNGTALKAIVNLPWLSTASDFRFEGTGDLNGDGSADILIRNYTNGNDAVWLMNGTTFSQVANLPALPDSNYRIAGGGDFNGDGRPDIVWRNQVTGNNAVWLMNGTSLIGVANLPALANAAYRFGALADYDGDGKTDIALRNYTNGANAIWLLDGVSLKSIANLPALSNTAYEIVGPR